MIIIKLLGGLGNQMFQYAAARSLIKENECVYLDHTFFHANIIETENSTIRSYMLDIFKNIKTCKAEPWQINLFQSQSTYYKIARHILKSSLKYIHHPDTNYISLSDLVGDKHIYLDGYFQSENYFVNNRNQILEDFQFPLLDPINEILKTKIENAPNAVSVHIRRGDYLTSNTISEIHGILPITYYYKAIDDLKEKCASMTLFIFSDDTTWAKENFNLSNFDIHFVDNNYCRDSWKDMALMSYCKHHIIANSSFSWWGAWLSGKNGYTYAPFNWFNSLKVDYDVHDIVPDKWIIVNYD